MRKLLTGCFCIMIFTCRVSAQEQLTMKQQADKLFDRFEYFNSLKLYLEIPDRKKDASVKEHIAECYRKMNRYAEAEKWYASLMTGSRASARALYNYAEVLFANKKFEEAKTQYRKFYGLTRNSADLTGKVAACDSAVLWTSQAATSTVSNMTSLNSSFADWGLSYFQNDMLVFTSDSLEGNGNRTYSWNGDGWLQLFVSQAGTGKREPLPLDLVNKYHIGPVVFNSGFDTAYVTVTNPSSKNNINVNYSGVTDQRLYTRRLELIMLTKTANQWKKSSAFPYNNPNRYSVGHAALSRDGKILYFTSDMPGGEGKTDIWYCEKLANGAWGKPVNCGKIINTKEEEAFPTIGGDNMLYFSSKGLLGMGGYDLFSTSGEKVTWSKPVNLKPPLNSSGDDFYLSTKDGINGYFSSNREGGKGNDDIYSFTRSATLASAREQEPLVNQHVPTPIPLAPALQAIPIETKAGNITEDLNITPDQLVVGKTFVLRNIYYDLDKSYIRPDAAVELDKLLAILNANPGLRIELSSHTDSRASDEYNLELSQRRAEAAVGYLVGKGIDRYRLVAKGYGETQLLNKCANGIECTEAEHQLNRRTEFKVLATSR